MGGGVFVENFFLLNLGVCVIMSPYSSSVSERTGIVFRMKQRFDIIYFIILLLIISEHDKLKI